MMQRGVMKRGTRFALLLLVATATIPWLPVPSPGEVLFIGEFGTGSILKVEYEVDGQGVPSLTSDPMVFDTGIAMPAELAMDGEGNLYVGSFGAGVDPDSPIYHYSDEDGDNCPDAGTRTMVLPGLTDVDGVGLPFDARQESSLLYVSAFGGSRTQDVLLFQEPGVRGKAIDLDNPVPIPTGAASIPVSQPVALALNPLGNLFVLDASSGWITVFRDANDDGVVEPADLAANDPVRFNALSASRDYFMDMAFSSSGLLYVLKADLENPANGQILVFRSDKSYLQLVEVPSLETPFATLAMDYSPANGIAFDPNHADNGLLFVSSTVSGSVKAFWDKEEPRWVADDPSGIDLVVGLAEPAGIAAMPFEPNKEEDEDGDGVYDFEDNCRKASNPGDPQPDRDLDGLGNACDSPDCGVLAELEYGQGGSWPVLSLLYYLIPWFYILWLLGRARRKRNAQAGLVPRAVGARVWIPWVAGLITILFTGPSPSYGITFQAVEEDYTISVNGQYRVRVLDIEPVKVNGPKPFNLGYASQRLRTDLSLAYKDKVSVKCQLNILDGVVMGDNGVWGDLSTSELGLPLLPNEGVKTSALVPNNGRIGIGLADPSMNPLDPNSYAPVFLDADPIQVSRVWGEVMLPFGMLRAGRQPATIGKSILVNDGDGLTNEFGVSKFGDTADRVLIGTKPVEIYRVIKAGMDTSVANDSIDEGVIAVVGYDFLAFNSITDDGEDVQQVVTALFYREPKFSFLGMAGEGLEMRLGAVYRFGEVQGRYFEQRQMFVNGVLRTIDEEIIDSANISVALLTGGMSFDLGPFFFDLELAGAYGSTEEIPKTINVISPGFYPSDKLRVRAWGAQMNMGYRIGNWEFALEVDYASGDDDPKDDVAEEFMFAEDTNVGLLLFEEVIAFERAQSAAAGTWNILNSYQALGRQSPSNPSTRVATNGAFANAIAVLPKVTYRFTDNLYVRTGVLAAWADKDVIDPVVLRTMAGNPRVNFNGGEPARFYGVEFLGRLEWWVWNHFVFDMEGAYLMPGAALEDADGRALDAWMWEARMTFTF